MKISQLYLDIVEVTYLKVHKSYQFPVDNFLLNRQHFR